MRTLFIAFVALVTLGRGLAPAAAPFFAEDFSTDPAAGGRFTVLTNLTESSFTYDPTNKNLRAVLDVDYDAAWYVSNPFSLVNESCDISFSFRFQITALDDSQLPSVYVGLMTNQHLNLGGDGLTAVLFTTNGQPAISAEVDQGAANSGGDAIRLAPFSNYLAVARYTASDRQFSLQIFGGLNFSNLLGTSITFATNAPGFGVDRLGLQNGGGQRADFTNGSITVVIDDLFIPAQPPVFLSVTNASLVEGDSGTTNMVFTARLSSTNVQTVQVDYLTANMTATADGDYVATNGTITFLPGVIATNIVVAVRGDVLAEPDETFKLLLTNAVNANLLTPEAVGTISNDDRCRIFIDDVTVLEPRSGTNYAQFTVTLNLTNSQAVSVNFTTSNLTAVAGSDYLATNGLLLFPTGVVAQSIIVGILADVLDESNETFVINLSNPTNATLGDGQGVGAIINTNPPSVVWVDGQFALFEGNSNLTAAPIVFHLAPPSGKQVMVTWATSNRTAIAGSDYRGTNQVATFLPGQTNVTNFVQIFGDRIFEPDEDFRVQILAVTLADLSNDVQIVTILNDDFRPMIDIDDTGVREGDSGTTNAIFRVRLSNPSSEPVSAHYTTDDDTATAANDYVMTNDTVVFPPVTNLVVSPSSVTQFVSVPVIGDTTNEADETFFLRLDSPVNATLGRAQATGVITNDDLVCLSVGDALVEESDTGTNLVFLVTLSGPAAQEVRVSFFTRTNTANTATPGADYLNTNGLLIFAVGVATQTVSVPILGDTNDEPKEFLLLVLTNAVNATICRTNGLGCIVDDDPPVIFIGNVGLDEGHSNTTKFVFPVTLTSADTNNEITVHYSTANGTATTNDNDYFATNGVLVFPTGVTSASICVYVIGDRFFESNETFFVNLDSPTNATLGSSRGTGTITNDDQSPIVCAQDVFLIEGTCTNFQITLSETSTLPVTVTYCLTNVLTNFFLICDSSCMISGPTNVPAACRSQCCTVVIPPGVLSTNLLLCVAGDSRDDSNAVYGGHITNLVNSRPGCNSRNSIQFIDTNPPVLLATNVFIAEGNVGLTNLCFTLRLTTPHDTNVSFEFFTTNGTAEANVDYYPTNGTIVFLPGEITQMVCVPIIGELKYETNETFFLVLTNGVNIVITNAVLRGTITNDDNPPRLAISDATLVEPDFGMSNLVFDVTVLDPTCLPVTVTYRTLNGTATNGLDYVTNTGTLTFLPGMTNFTISVSILGDTNDEPDETFFVRLTNIINATLAYTNSVGTNGVGTILDNDPTEIRLRGTNGVVEGNTGMTNLLPFDVRLSLANTNPVSVDFFTKDGTAQEGVDYFGTSGTNGTLVFPPGTTNLTVFVPIIGETLTELDETVLLCLTNPTNGRLIDTQASGTITNDDNPCVLVTGVTVQEDPNGPTNVVIQVTLNFTSSLPISVNYALSNGTATAGADFINAAGLLVFDPGVTNTNFVVTIIQDGAVEPTNETFFVQLYNPTNVQLCLPRSTNVIVDGTIPPVITVSDAGVLEGNANFTLMNFTATLSRSSTQAVMVDFRATNGTALAGSDYVATNGTVVFLPGVTNTNFFVRVVGECVLEADEYFLVNLTNARLATNGTAQVTGTITNDDAAPTLLVSNPVVRERDTNATNAVFFLLLSCSNSFVSTVNFATTNSDALAGFDYVATNGTITFAPGVTNATIVVPVLGDYDCESNETFLVEFSNTNNLLIATNRAVGTILDDDCITVGILDAAPVNEGLPASFSVFLSKPPTSPRTVEYATVDGSASTNTFDYRATNGVLVFNAGVTNQTVTVTTLADGLDESNETFCVVLSNPFHLTLEAPKAAGTILDTNPPCLSVNDTNIFDYGTNRLEMVFTVSLSSTWHQPISVRYTTTNGTALSGSDYVNQSGLLVFAPGQLSTNLVVPVSPNTREETNEFLCVRLFNPTNATICKPLGCGTIQILSNAPPTVALLDPPDGVCVTTPTNLPLIARATDSDGFILRAEFYTNGTRLGEVRTNAIAPGGGLRTNVYELPWINPAPGEYAVTAVAVDNLFAASTSAPVRVSVRSPALLSINSTNRLEGDTGTNLMSFTVSLTSPSCQTVKVDVVTVEGTALAGSDYLPVSTSLVFDPGATQQLVGVPIRGDTEMEPDETFCVILTNVVNASIARGKGTGTIINDDTNPCPFVVINNIATNAVFYTPPGLIRICADARDPNGFIVQVEFYVGTNFIGRSTEAPFCATWTNHTTGRYVLTAVATDDGGCRVTSPPVDVSVTNCPALTITKPADQTVCACEMATFSTTITSAAPTNIVWKANGRVIPNATNASLTLYSLKPGDAGEYAVEVSTACRTIVQRATLTVNDSGAQSPAHYVNSGLITIGEGNAVPYPSTINVKCLPGVMQKLTVTLAGLSHEFLGDVDIILVSPSRQAIRLISDVGEDGSGAENLNLTLMDGAPLIQPIGPFTSGTYAPTDYDSEDTESPPAGSTWVTNLAAFIGQSPNGAWELYVSDDAARQTGEIRGGWSLDIEWSDGPPRLYGPQLTNTHFQFVLVSQANRTHVVEGSTDLVEWYPISTNVMIGTNMTLNVPRLPGQDYAFFRVVRCPCISPVCFACVARLSAPALQADGQFQMTLNSAPGKSHVIEQSTDLITWKPVRTNVMNSAVQSLLMPAATNATHRFYRAIRCP